MYGLILQTVIVILKLFSADFVLLSRQKWHTVKLVITSNIQSYNRGLVFNIFSLKYLHLHNTISKQSGMIAFKQKSKVNQGIT